MTQKPIVFIGGGNMAQALIGGLLKTGFAAQNVWVVEPDADQRTRLQQRFSLAPHASAGAQLAGAGTVVWAVKPQLFAVAAAPCALHVQSALHISVMAGVRSSTLVQTVGTEQVVRAMPNTPALIGQGVAGLFARPAVGAAARAETQALFAPTGATLWLAEEDDLDAVTALSGSGPAYVFYFLEAMEQAALEMGLTAEQGRLLAHSTFAGAAALARSSPLPSSTLREQVTSKGGTTFAAITSLDTSGVKAAFVQALHAARSRAQELGRG
jgi:pyrroline-5-carboxylate reductase